MGSEADRWREGVPGELIWVGGSRVERCHRKMAEGDRSLVVPGATSGGEDVCVLSACLPRVGL